MSDTHTPGDRSSDPGSHYGTCLREREVECRVCNDTGIASNDIDGIEDQYCQCDTGRYLERVEEETGGPVEVTYRR